MKSILIVGSGLSAWATCVSILESNQKNYSLSFIDPSVRFESVEKATIHTPISKNLLGSNHMYAKPDSHLEFDGITNLSYAKGGLSNVWGAGIRLWSFDKVAKMVSDQEGFYASASNLLQKMGYIGDSEKLNLGGFIPPVSGPMAAGRLSSQVKTITSGKVQVFQTPLSVKTSGQNMCRSCGSCLSGCPYGAIFNSGDQFDLLVSQGKISRMEGKVLNLSSIGDKIVVIYDDKNNQKEAAFDTVYLCAGAVGTPAILLRSSLITSNVRIRDSQVFYFGGFYKRKSKAEGAFALSQLTIFEEDRYSCSLYESSHETRMRVSNRFKFLGKFLKLPKILDSYMFFGIGFLPSEKSGHIVISKGDLSPNSLKLEYSRNHQTPRAVKDARKSISKILRDSKFYTFPFTFFPKKPGSGFHSGGGLSLGGELVDNFGSLRVHKNIKISDASILPDLHAGPHTLTTMTINHLLAQKSS